VPTARLRDGEGAGGGKGWEGLRAPRLAWDDPRARALSSAPAILGLARQFRPRSSLGSRFSRDLRLSPARDRPPRIPGCRGPHIHSGLGRLKARTRHRASTTWRLAIPLRPHIGDGSHQSNGSQAPAGSPAASPASTASGLAHHRRPRFHSGPHSPTGPAQYSARRLQPGPGAAGARRAKNRARPGGLKLLPLLPPPLPPSARQATWPAFRSSSCTPPV